MHSASENIGRSLHGLLKDMAPDSVASSIKPSNGFVIETPEGKVDFTFKNSRQMDSGRWLICHESPLADAEMEVTCRPRERAVSCRVTLHAKSPMEITGIHPLWLELPAADRGNIRARYLTGGSTHALYPSPDFHETYAAISRGHDLGVYISSLDGGRTSSKHLPFLQMEFGGGGVIGAMEWSGPWIQHVMSGHSAETAVWRATIPLNAAPSSESSPRPGDPAEGGRTLTLEKGEVFALPAVHLVFFEGGRDEGGNAIRRYLYNIHCPNLSGQKPLPPLSYDHWFGLGLSIDETTMRTQAMQAARLGIEYFVLDAGWYQGSAEALRKVLSGERRQCPWMLSEGNWDDCEREWFPRGIEPLADYVRSLGMKFGLFVEMPRSGRDSRWVQQHPELFIDIGGEILHMNLALKKVQDLVVETIQNIIRKTGACWFRWEMGMGPLACWEQMRNPRFMFEYEAGLASIMDRILASHPDLFIELCAEGGNRIDLSTLKRGHSFWFSDACENREVTRSMQCGANRFLPGNFANAALPIPSKTTMIGFLPHSPDPGRRCDPSDADIVSRMCGGLQFGGDIARMSDSVVARARCLNDIYKRIRHLLVQDFHPLTNQPWTPDDGEAVMFVGYEKTSAVLIAFSGIGQADDDICVTFNIKGLSRDVVYKVTDLLDDGMPLCQETGDVLMSRGLNVKIRRGTALYGINS